MKVAVVDEDDEDDEGGEDDEDDEDDEKISLDVGITGGVDQPDPSR
ncbi:hypothetical protein ACH4ND_08050 [Streptomyces sp. NPDC017179]